jgi:hypothetical protein
MSAITDYIHANPIKSISTVVVFIGSIITTVWAVDDRYVLKKELIETKTALNEERESGITSIKSLILMQYEDQINELNYKKNSEGLNPYEKTRLESIKQRAEVLRK